MSSNVNNFLYPREYNIQLNKADLNVFDKAEGKIYVTRKVFILPQVAKVLEGQK